MIASSIRLLRRHIPLSALVLLSSCSLFEPELPSGVTRDEHFSGQTHKLDTILLVSAVSFPRSYDWQRDSAFGQTESTILLYRDGKKEHSIKAGPGTGFSSSSECHHIIGASLFTVNSDSKGTRIGKNGRIICSWSERERIFGLLEKDGSLYTLGREAGSEGLTYRRDGKQLLKIAKAEPFGGFRTDGYGQNGALYESGGCVCFACRSALDGVTTVKLFRDGAEELLLSASRTEVLDAKLLNDSPAILYNEAGVTMMSYGGRHFNVGHSGGLLWQTASLVLFEGRASALGSFRMRDNQELIYGVGWENSALIIKGSPDYLYCDGVNYGGIDPSTGDLQDFYFMNRDCACQLGSSMVLGLTPKDASQPPRVRFAGKEYSYPMHGFITGVSYIITE